MGFEPRFAIAENVFHAAEIINVPHEPKAIIQTAIAIESIWNYVMAGNVIYEYIVRQTHQGIVQWLSAAGVYRTCDVQINEETLSWLNVASDMRNLHPFTVFDIGDLERWYTAFETIHPFEDGNGRVGGAIIAGYSWRLFNKILVPLQ